MPYAAACKHKPMTRVRVTTCMHCACGKWGIPAVIVAFQSVTYIHRMMRLCGRIRCLVLRHLVIK